MLGAIETLPWTNKRAFNTSTPAPLHNLTHATRILYFTITMDNIALGENVKKSLKILSIQSNETVNLRGKEQPFKIA